jgi:hypothetical protein
MSETISPPFGRARRGRGEPGAERDRDAGARGRELDDAKAVEGGVVGVEPPAQALVELLGPVDVGYRDDLDLQVHVDRPGGRAVARVVYFGGAHGCLLSQGRPQWVFVSVSLAAGAPARRGGKYPKHYLLPRNCPGDWRPDTQKRLT